MRADDLDLQELLDHDRETGILRIGGERALLVDAVAAGVLRKDLIERVGLTATRNLLTRQGYVQGWRTAEALRQRFRWDDLQEWHRAAFTLNPLLGWARQEPVESGSATNAAGRPPLMQAIWRDSSEAEQHLQQIGPADAPVCWGLCGWIDGYLSFAHGRPIRCLESRCRGKGDPHCVAIVRALDDWDEKERGELFFHEDCVAEAIDRLTVQLKASEQLLRKRRDHLRRLQVEETEPGIVVKSDAMCRLLEMAKRVASVDSTVLILGESGVGKELVSRFIHEHSTRAERPFIAVNCGAIPDDLLESELFGHARGAFTGAVQERIGLFEAANGGTLFLDEIGEISPAMQVALLRALQERQIRRVGENRQRPVNVRVIAATLRDLSKDIASGRFREDLFYRLGVIELTIPPLRERREDVLPLARLFVANFATRMKRRIEGLTPEAADQLLRHDWPGNVRELENAMERAVALTLDRRIGLDDLPEPVRRALPVPVPGKAVRALRAVERDYILAVLDRNDGNQSRTAAQLGIGIATLYRKLKQYKRPATRPSPRTPSPRTPAAARVKGRR